MEPDLGATEKIVAEKLERDARNALKESKRLFDFLSRLNDEDMHFLVVDPQVKPILEALVAFVEGVGNELENANMAATLIATIFTMRDKARGE